MEPLKIRLGFTVERRVDALEREFGLVIVLPSDTSFFPSPWKDDFFGAKAEPITKNEAYHALPSLQKALHRYPSRIVADNIDTIFLLEQLEFYGAEYAGTTYENNLYMACEHGYNEEFIRRIFHHEFSSILMRNYGFDFGPWTATNDSSIRYATDMKTLIDAVKDGYSNEGTGQLYHAGFLTRYATSLPENDVNTYCEELFVNGEALRARAAAYPRIGAKYAVLRSFLLSIHENFAPLVPPLGPDPHGTLRGERLSE
jgi:hypothetical protein